MAESDPTEWRFAQKHLDGWDHFESLQACSWFMEHLAGWRKELELKMKSESLARIFAEARTTSRESFNANKYILEKGWAKETPESKRGRPSKEEVRKAASEIASIDRRLNQDAQRLNIVRLP